MPPISRHVPPLPANEANAHVLAMYWQHGRVPSHTCAECQHWHTIAGLDTVGSCDAMPSYGASQNPPVNGAHTACGAFTPAAH